MKVPQKQEIPEWVLSKMKQYCAYQERSMFDVRTKLKTFHLQEGMDEQIILKLKNENYLDEARFARMFATGKIRNNKWGKIRIYSVLQRKKVPEFFILQGLNQIEDEEYEKILTETLVSKNKLLKEEDNFKRKQKLAKFAAGKGFETDVIWRVIESMKI